ncbi:hypothetical protein IPF86_04090 [Candidatus Nomurabacteria bacterium]|nr:MAG: hypothetical protein IPF86_04090 [Candidatus Nomurabacteria bacterium]
MQTVLTFFIAFALFLPIFLLELQNKYLLTARIPHIILLLRVLFLNPYKGFQKISDRSLNSRHWNFPYSPSTQADEEWYQRHLEWGYSRRIGWRSTLIIANRILEFRCWMNLRSCKNYDELLNKALTQMSKMNAGELVFISSPLYAHPHGVRKGIKELRKMIINAAEEHGGLIFNQIPFLNLRLPNLSANETRNKFEVFYEPIICSPFISKVIMNQGWEISLGCKTEYEVAIRHAKQIEYYKKVTSLL